MIDYDAVVYDLDGTLVILEVDWAAAAADVRERYLEAGIEPPGEGLWAMLEASEDHGLGAAVEAEIAAHERAGARRSPRLARADELLAREVPVGVCSLNAESACRIALEQHGLAGAVDVVVGRDTVSNHKPHPEPLLAAVEALGAEPGRTLFVGDTERDERTARRAGTAFEYVDDGPREH